MRDMTMNGSTNGMRVTKYKETVGSNAKVFAKMIKKLSSADQSKDAFLGVINTLEIWLRVEKAYYAEARPIIVTLLETAMNALSRILVLKDGAHIHVSQCSLEAQAQFSAYARLLATVEQYEQLFREDLKLHRRLINLVNTIQFNDESQPVTFQSRPPIYFSVTSPAAEGSPEHRVEGIGATANPTDTNTMPSVSIRQSSEEVSNQVGMSTFPAKPQTTDAITAPTVNTTKPSSILLNPGVPATPSQNAFSQIGSADLSNTPQPPPKTESKLKRLLSLAKVDKESWKRNKTSRTAPVSEENIDRASLTEKDARPLPFSSLDAISTPITPAPPNPTSPTPIHSLPYTLSSQEIINSGEALDAGSKTVVTIPLQSSQLHDVSDPESTTYMEDAEMVDNQLPVAPSSLVKPKRNFNFSDGSKDSLLDSSRKFLTLSQNPSSQAEVTSPLANHFVDFMQDFISLKYEYVKSLFDSETHDGTTSSNFVSKPDSLSSKRARSPIADDGRPHVRQKRNSGDVIPDEPHEFLNPSLSTKNPSRTLFYHPDPPFRTCCVFAPRGGSFSCNFTFETDDNQLDLARRWVNRHETFEKALPCLSFTLACVKIPDPTSYPEDDSVDKIIRNLNIEWPQDGDFCLKIETSENVPVTLPMAPPLSIRNCEPLDLTPYIRLKTSITFISDRDYSEYVFTLRAHSPTESQLHHFYQASSLMSPAPDAWGDLWPVNHSASPIRSLLADLSL